MKRLLAVLLIVGVIGVAGCAGSGQATGSSSTTLVDWTGTTFGFDNWSTVYSNPDGHKGALVDITGQVFSIERGDAGVFIQVWADPFKVEWDTIVSYADRDFAVEEDDYVHVTGRVYGALLYKNARGEELQAPVVIASTLEVVGPTDAGPKPIRTVERSWTFSQHGVVITIDKVEFTSRDTRVYLAVTNTSGVRASFHPFYAKASQGTRQFESDPYNDYPEVAAAILPGIKSSGVVAFGPLDPAKETKVYLEARSDDFSLDFELYVFTIPPG